MVVIRIETERLLLRPMGVEDVDAMLELHSQPAVSHFLGAATRELALERLERCERNWGQGDYDLLAVLDRSTGEFLGRSGVKYWPEFNETEVGWAFRRQVWGHGYATEAARGSIDWAFRVLPVPYVTAMIRPDNSRSAAVARRLDMTPIREDIVVGIPVTVHAIQRERWGVKPSPHEIRRLLSHVREWAELQDALVAIAVVGVPGGSDAELIFLSGDPAGFPDAEQWATELGAVVLASGRRGALIEHRLATASGLELRITIGSVLPEGCELRALYDPRGLITEAVA